LVPKGLRAHVKQQLQWAGLPGEERKWLGTLVVQAFVLGLLGAALVQVVLSMLLLTVLAFIAVFLFVFAFRLLILHNRVEKRAAIVESMLPDALRVTASNIKAGMVPLVALRMAARPELGPLREEIEWVTAKSMGTGSLVDALRQISSRIKSKTLERSLSLFASALKSGGTLSLLLENIAEEIRTGMEMREQLIAGTRMYVFFILFTVIIAMPALLSVSLQFVDIVDRMEFANTQVSQNLGLYIASPLNYDTLFMISVVTLVMTSLFASALIGVVHRGRKLAGYGYVPITVIGSIAFFLIMRQYILQIFFPV